MNITIKLIALSVMLCFGALNAANVDKSICTTHMNALNYAAFVEEACNINGNIKSELGKLFKENSCTNYINKAEWDAAVRQTYDGLGARMKALGGAKFCMDNKMQYFGMYEDIKGRYAEQVGNVLGSSNTQKTATSKIASPGTLDFNEQYFTQAVAAANRGDFEQSQQLSQKSADMGNTWAMNFIGRNALLGRGEPKNNSKALLWTEKAAKLGNPAAQDQLGYMYFNGTGTVKDLTAAAGWYEKAALQGLAHAQSNLGICYMNGLGVEKDLIKAKYWLEKSVAQGDEQGKKNLALFVQSKPREKSQFDICQDGCIGTQEENVACTIKYNASICQSSIDSCIRKCFAKYR